MSAANRSRFAGMQIPSLQKSSLFLSRSILIDNDIDATASKIISSTEHNRSSLSPTTPGTPEDIPVTSNLKNRRVNSLLFSTLNPGLKRIMHQHVEGYLTPSSFSTISANPRQLFKSITERNQRLTHILSQPKQLIDLRDTDVQQLSVDISRKAIKSQKEIQFLLRVFHQHGSFSEFIDFPRQHQSLILNIHYEFHAKGSVIYETGDFGLKYYLLISGRLAQLLPTSADIVLSPMKVSARRKLTLNSLRRAPSSIEEDPLEFIESPTIPHHFFNRELLPGEHFGDSELFSRQRRGYSVMCSEDSHVLSLSKEVFERLIGAEKQRVISKKLEFFKQFNFLENVPDSILLQIIDTAVHLTPNVNTTIFDESSLTDMMYFITSGEVQLSKLVDMPFDNSNAHYYANNTNSSLLLKRNEGTTNSLLVPLFIIPENNFFGEHEILSQNPTRITRAQCTSQSTQILAVSSKKLLQIVRQHGYFERLSQKQSAREIFIQQRISLLTSQKQEQLDKQPISPPISREQHANISQSIPSNISSTRRSSFLSSSPFSNSNDSKLFHSPNQKVYKTLSDSDIQFSSSQTEILPPKQKHKIHHRPTASTSSYFIISSNSFAIPSASSIPTSLNIRLSSSLCLPETQRSIEETPKPSSLQFKRQYTLHSPNSLQASVSDLNDETSTSSPSSMKIIRGSVTTKATPAATKCQINKLQNFRTTQPRGYILHEDSNDTRFQNESRQKIQEDMHRNLFTTYVETAQRKIEDKQQILNKLTMSNTSSSSNQSSQYLFQDQFNKGFKNMFLRKFGKQFNRK